MNWKQFFGIAGISAGLALNAFGARPYDRDTQLTPNIVSISNSRQALFEFYNNNGKGETFGQIFLNPFLELDNLATSAYTLKSGFTRHDAVVKAIKEIEVNCSKLKDTPRANEMRRLVPGFIRGQLAVINRASGSSLTYTK